MDFTHILGQRGVISGLENAIRNNKVGHAYIFNGLKGIGKKTTAKAFAGMLLCNELKVSEDGGCHKTCGQCFSCRMLDNGSNPDFHVIEAANASISVEDIRKIQSDIFIKPIYSKRKVYLIVDADKMTVQAQNCLLKTLEEPPVYAVIILTTSNYDALMETIRSRVLKYSLKNNTAEEVRNCLETRLGKVPGEADFIISYSDGVIGTALELADSEEFVRTREKTLEIVLRLAKAKLLDIFDIYDFFEDNKSNVEAILDIMILFYRDVLIAKKGWKENILINSDKKDIILNNISNFSTQQLVRNIEVIEETRRNIKYNANYQLAIEMMLIKLQEEFN